MQNEPQFILYRAQRTNVNIHLNSHICTTNEQVTFLYAKHLFMIVYVAFGNHTSQLISMQRH